MILRHLVTAAVRISHRPSRGLHKYRAATTTMAKSGTACIFCKICRGENKETRIFYQDEELVVFKDHKPAATHHYLVCPKDHIPDPKSLTKAHLGLVERMIQVGNRVLQENCGNTDDVRMGFHWPPFNLVRHLHLHVISPQGHMGWVARAIFLPDSYWFVSEKWMLERLRKMEGES